MRGFSVSFQAPIIIAAYAEIALKGRNRPVFLRRLINNIKVALASLPVQSVDHVESRLLIRLADSAQAPAVVDRLRKVFGLQWVSPAIPVMREDMGDDLAGLCTAAVAMAKQDVGEARSFKIETHRSDRTFPLESPEINRIVGTQVQAAIQLPAKMQHPDFTLYILVLKEGALLFTRKQAASGGLPAGSSGRVMVLLSGGIDSPVAAWQLMRRGCRPEFVHFYSGRSVAEADADKIIRLVNALAAYSPVPLNLHLVPVYAYELRAIGKIYENYDMVMFRRFMFKTAASLARQASCLALVTGDSLGQVASQTLANLAAITPDVELPVFRPLIGMDKVEITNLASKIETYAISIEPYRDCCSIRSPHPKLNASAAELLQLSAEMDLEAAIAEALQAAEKVVLPLAGAAAPGYRAGDGADNSL
jgi:thiamine biosynthesis protein ThiI